MPGQGTEIPHAIQYGQKKEYPKKKKKSRKKSQLMSLMCSLGQGT